MTGLTCYMLAATARMFFDPLARVPDYIREKNWFVLVAPVKAFGVGRDRTMAKNIARTLEARPEEDTLLVVAGRKHITGYKTDPGVARLLLSQYGFSERDPVEADPAGPASSRSPSGLR